MDNALDSDSKDCRFDSGRADHQRDAGPNMLPANREHIFMFIFQKSFWYLKAACEELERVKWHGRAVSKDQPLSFPRLPYQERTEEKAPERIKRAQAELALWLSDEQGQEDLRQREQIRLQGIKSVSLGSLSMSFAEGARSELALLCPAAVKLIAPYLNGGYETE